MPSPDPQTHLVSSDIARGQRALGGVTSNYHYKHYLATQDCEEGGD